MHLRTIILILLLFFNKAYSQSADELNNSAKDFLSHDDVKNAFPFLERAASLGNAEAEYNLGYCYQSGTEVVQNDSIANFWYLNAAKLGWKDAEYKISISYANGRGIEKNNEQAFYWSKKCAEQNDPECMFNLISCYSNGIGTKKDIHSMIDWAIRLATLENPEDLELSGKITSARLNLAEMYNTGKNVPVDLLKSYMWYLIYNESKKDFSILVQQQQIEAIQALEKGLSTSEKTKAKTDAETLLKHPLTNLDNLYKQDL